MLCLWLLDFNHCDVLAQFGPAFRVHHQWDRVVSLRKVEHLTVRQSSRLRIVNAKVLLQEVDKLLKCRICLSIDTSMNTGHKGTYLEFENSENILSVCALSSATQYDDLRRGQDGGYIGNYV